MDTPLTLLQHFAEVQHCLKRFSQLGENKHKNIMNKTDQLSEKSQKAYTNKINYLSLASRVNDKIEK